MNGDRPVPAWLSVSRETLDDLIALESLVLRWTVAVNLVSRSSQLDIWNRHILDSAQIASFSGFPSGNWADFGSGGGFPALVLAVMAKHRGDGPMFTLIESDARKATFLRQAALTLALNVKVVTARVGDVPRLAVSVVTARALAPLDELLGMTTHHLSPTGRAYFPKGASFAQEIGAAEARWRFKLTIHKSHTDPNAAILEVSNIDLR
jgi:16S rRNA (guanine527-N7)-methyltransferase